MTSPRITLNGIVNGSFIVFILLFLFSIPFGRLFCSFICPAGGLQEQVMTINSGKAKQGWKNNIKYMIWVIWISMVILCYIYRGEILEIDFWFRTSNGISVSDIQSYVIYYGIVFLILIPSILFGKRAFCHYICWMAPFMTLGIKLRRLSHLPGLHVKIKNSSKCISCDKCSTGCPMGLPVHAMVKDGQINTLECIQCGACIDNCPSKIFSYAITKEKGEG